MDIRDFVPGTIWLVKYPVRLAAARFQGRVRRSRAPALRFDRVRGRLMSEVALLHRPTRTLLLVDLVERFGDDTPA